MQNLAILGVATVAGVTFAAISFHDPDALVRVWAVIGFGCSVVAAMVAIASSAPQGGPR